MSTYPPSYWSSTIPYTALCIECGDEGMITMSGDFLAQCPTCNGAGRDAIPWTELFKRGTYFIPLFDLHENEDEGY